MAVYRLWKTETIDFVATVEADSEAEAREQAGELEWDFQEQNDTVACVGVDGVPLSHGLAAPESTERAPVRVYTAEEALDDVLGTYQWCAVWTEADVRRTIHDLNLCLPERRAVVGNAPGGFFSQREVSAIRDALIAEYHKLDEDGGA